MSKVYSSMGIPSKFCNNIIVVLSKRDYHRVSEYGAAGSWRFPTGKSELYLSFTQEYG